LPLSKRLLSQLRQNFNIFYNHELPAKYFDIEISDIERLIFLQSAKNDAFALFCALKTLFLR